MDPSKLVIGWHLRFQREARRPGIDDEISCQQSAITDAKERIKLYKGMDDSMSVKEHGEAVHDLQKVEKGLKGLRALRHKIATNWEVKEKRVLGELAWAPPISSPQTRVSTPWTSPSSKSTRASSTPTTTAATLSTYIGNKYTRKELMDKVYLHPTSPTSFKFPADRLVPLQGQVLESNLVKLTMLEADNELCLIVFKNSAKTDTTIGKANNISSYTRNYFGGQYKESREWPVIPTNKHSGAFSTRGDSGSCVADVFCRVGGILTGGSGATGFSDLTYVTPISFIMKVLHDTKRFQYAHLNPDLTR